MLTNSGRSRRLARAKASSHHGHQSTGFAACCSRYGLVHAAKRLVVIGSCVIWSWLLYSPRMDAAPCLLLAELAPLDGVGAGWLALLGALGVVLVVRGARMLPLLVLVAGGLAGWAIGIRMHQSFALRVPEWAAALAAALIVATVSVVFLRVGVAWMMALLSSALCILLSCAMVDRGILNPSPVSIVRGGAPLTDGRSTPMLGDAAPTPRDLAPTLLEAMSRSWADVPADAGFIARTTGAWRHMRARTDAWWERMPPTTQTLVSAFGWGGFAAGFVAAFFFSRAVPVLLTSIVGSALAVATVACFAQRLSGGRVALPPQPWPWLSFIGAGTVLGLLLQSARTTPKPEPAPEQPTSDHG